MKIKSVTLNNIGLYSNERINFNYEGDNLIIVWGNNGAGKTTLLNSIKVALFGEEAFQYNRDQYFKFIREGLVSSRCNEISFSASISIDILINENNRYRDYTFLRKWDINNENIDEVLEIYFDNKKLNFIEKEELVKRTKLTLPPSLLDVIIFDGEKAINILNNNEMPKLIKNIVYTTFGMDVYANLSKDLSLYLRNINLSDTSTSSEQLKLIELENNYKSSLLEYNKLSNTINELNKEMLSNKRSLSMHSKFIFEKTGINFEEILDFQKNLNDEVDNKKKVDDEARYILETILPYKILHSKIKELLVVIEKEKPFQVLNNINILKSFFANDLDSIKMINDLEKKIKSNEEVTFKYNISNFESEKIELLNSTLNNYTKEKLLDFYQNKNQNYLIIKEKQKQIEKLNDPICNEKISQILDLTNTISNLNQTLVDLSNKLDESEILLSLAKFNYDQYKKEMLKVKKTSNTYTNVLAYRELIDEFIINNIKKICKDLNHNLLSELSRINFRNGSIKKVEISPKSFEVKLFEKNNKLVSSSLFSAGEKQILLGLVIKESLELSDNDTFFLFDTPVGRLDMNNRSLFTNEVIMKISDQVIVFATDSDYSEKDYNLIKENITQELILKRNELDEIIVDNNSIY